MIIFERSSRPLGSAFFRLSPEPKLSFLPSMGIQQSERLIPKQSELTHPKTMDGQRGRTSRPGIMSALSAD